MKLLSRPLARPLYNQNGLGHGQLKCEVNWSFFFLSLPPLLKHESPAPPLSRQQHFLSSSAWQWLFLSASSHFPESSVAQTSPWCRGRHPLSTRLVTEKQLRIDVWSSYVVELRFQINISLTLNLLRSPHWGSSRSASLFAQVKVQSVMVYGTLFLALNIFTLLFVTCLLSKCHKIWIKLHETKQMLAPTIFLKVSIRLHT